MRLEQAVAHALRLGAISFDAVKMLLLAKLENLGRRGLIWTFYPYLAGRHCRNRIWIHAAYLDLVANARPASMVAGALA